MKKNKLFVDIFLISLLSFSNINLISCGSKKNIVNNENDNNFTDKQSDFNYIIDLNKDYQRNYQENLAYKNHLNKFVNNSLKRKLTIKEEQLCQKVNLALNSSCSKNSLAKFDDFVDIKTFISFEQLVEVINEHNRKFNHLYIDLPFETFIDLTGNNKEVFKQTILLIYNTFCNFFGEKAGIRIVKVLAAFEPDEDEKLVYGETSTEGSLICIKINRDVFFDDFSNTMLNQFNTGHYSNYNPFQVIVHEFGHALYGFDGRTSKQREDVFLFSGLNTYSLKLPLHNKWKKDKCSQLNNPTYYRFAGKDEPVWINYENSNEVERINFEKEIKKFLEKNVKIIDDNFNEDEKTIFKNSFLPGMVISSDYAQQSDYETQAEGFAYWLLTSEDQRNKLWELWNEFFLEYLPNLRHETLNFYNFQKKVS